VTGGGGSSTSFRNLVIPFHEEVVPAFEQAGLPNVGEEFHRLFPGAPVPPAHKRITNALGVEELLILVGVYLATKIGDTAVQKLLHGVYDNAVQPAVRKLWAKLRRGHGAALLSRITLDHWFRDSDVLVRVCVVVDEKSEAPDAGALVAQALTEAQKILGHQVLTGAVLTYEVTEGEMSEPVISFELP